jgi:hypothetical protein
MFSYYLKLERLKTPKKDGSERKTPAYTGTLQAGYFKPSESLKNASGDIVMYCQRNDKCNPNSKSELRLQCKGSINFSSIYFLNIDACKLMTGYGEPPFEKMFKPKKVKNTDGGIKKEVERPNPFYENRNDGYLFIVALGGDNIPETIEILVMSDGRHLIQGYAKQLADGQFTDALNQIRSTAK